MTGEIAEASHHGAVRVAPFTHDQLAIVRPIGVKTQGDSAVRQEFAPIDTKLRFAAANIKAALSGTNLR